MLPRGREVPCFNTATTVTMMMLFCLNTLPVAVPKENHDHSGVQDMYQWRTWGGGGGGMFVPLSARPTLVPIQLQRVLVVHTLWGLRLLFDYRRLSREGWGHSGRTSVGSPSC